MVALVYAIVAGLWISFSDAVFLRLVPAGIIVHVSVIKGELFVIVTALMLFSLIGRYLDRLSRSEQQYAEAQQLLMQKEKAIRQGYVEVLDAITGGKLIIVTDNELVALLGKPLGPTRELVSGAQLGEARSDVQARLECAKLVDGDAFILAFSEACTNALKHAGGGTYSAYLNERSIQLMVRDTGPGIDFKTLSKATLIPGYSTTNTLGMGFTIMLDVCDRVLLETDASGTAVVLELRLATVPESAFACDVLAHM